MDYFNNSDLLNTKATPTRASGVQIAFTDESEFVEPWDLHEFKQFAKIDFATDDNLISAFLLSARQAVEQYLQQSLGVRTINLLALELPKNYRLPFGPVDEIITEGFTLFGAFLKEGGKDMEIEYTTSDRLVNENIKNAIYRQALHNYENREKYLEPKFASGLIDEVKIILQPYRIVQFP